MYLLFAFLWRNDENHVHPLAVELFSNLLNYLNQVTNNREEICSWVDPRPVTNLNPFRSNNTPTSYTGLRTDSTAPALHRQTDVSRIYHNSDKQIDNTKNWVFSQRSIILTDILSLRNWASSVLLDWLANSSWKSLRFHPSNSTRGTILTPFPLDLTSFTQPICCVCASISKYRFCVHSI